MKRIIQQRQKKLCAFWRSMWAIMAGEREEELMSIKQIRAALEKALLHDGAMSNDLYSNVLKDFTDELQQSLIADNDDYIFTVVEEDKAVAMVLLERSGQIYINEQARARLQELWPAAYASNMQQFIPFFAQQLNQGQLPINGVKVAK